MRAPSLAESASLCLLRTILHELTPIVAQLFDEKRTSYTVAATDVLAGELRRGRDYRSREIFLTTHVFEADLAHSLAVYLHEHSHIFGYDGSRGFTDALTEVLEIVIRQRQTLEAFELQWEMNRQAVREERASSKENPADDPLAEIANLNRDELLAILNTMPRPALRGALSKRRNSESH